MKSNKVLVVSLFVALALAFWRSQPRTLDKAQPLGLPSPHRFVGVALVWTMLAVLAVLAPQVAAAFGVGIDVALALVPAQAGGPLDKVPGLAASWGPPSPVLTAPGAQGSGSAGSAYNPTTAANTTAQALANGAPVLGNG